MVFHLAEENFGCPLFAMRDADQELKHGILRNEVSPIERAFTRDPEICRSTFRVDLLFKEGMLHWIYSGDTWLHLAAAAHSDRVIPILIQHGADPNAAGSRRKGAPLHYAADGCVGEPWWCEVRQVQTVRCLLTQGSAVNARDANGATPLHRAVRARCAAVVKVLMEAGADPEARNASGSTPFHLAVQSTGRGGSGNELAIAAQKSILKEFVRRKVSVALKSAEGLSVLDWADRSWVGGYLRTLR